MAEWVLRENLCCHCAVMAVVVMVVFFSLSFSDFFIVRQIACVCYLILNIEAIYLSFEAHISPIVVVAVAVVIVIVADETEMRTHRIHTDMSL